MTDFTIVEARPWHCGQMVRALRLEHQAAVVRMGLDSHRELSALFKASSYRRAWMVNGKLAGLVGVGGALLDPYGFIWLTLTQSALRYPVEIIKESRRQLKEIMVVKRELATTILADDMAARRFAIFLGFHVSHDGDGGPAFSRQGRISLARHLDDEPKHRIIVGSSFIIPMGYHAESEAA